MALSAIAKAVVTVFLNVASVAYQQAQHRKMQKEADKRKGFQYTVSGEAVSLPVVYGKQLLGGISTSRTVQSNFSEGASSHDNLYAIGLGTDDINGTKNEFLNVQYALCHEGIEGVQHVLVDGLDFDDSENGFKHRIRTYNNTLSSEPASHSSAGFRPDNLFTGCASCTATYQLNRDDYNYNGEPSIQFLIQGRKVRSVVLLAGVYSLSGTYAYSNNPALCLLDYLTNSDFGRGLPESKIDLQSFYHSAQVCDTIVSTGRAVGGKINGGDTTRDLPLYECNMTLDTEQTIRSNVEFLLESMPFAEMMWTPSGQYKLTLDYPASLVETEALIDVSHHFTEDSVLRKDIGLSWLPASSRMNQCTVNFLNEHEDFKDDSATWPKFGTTAYNTYLTEDNSQPFRKTLEVAGITDPYHALARAEQEVRKSRQLFTIEFTTNQQGLTVEPGDLIKVTLEQSGLVDEVFKVTAMEASADLSVEISAYSFTHETLAWNVNDDIAYATKPVYDFTIDPVTALTYTAGRPDADTTAIGELTWDAPNDGSYEAQVFYTKDNGNLKRLGETSNDSFLIYPRTEWDNNESVTFTVKSKTPLGKRSTGVAVTASLVRKPATPTSFSVTETLYQTNRASGVKARATISFSEPSGGVAPKDYRVRFYRDEDGSTYKLLGFTVGEEYIIDDIRAGNYHFEITAISHYGHRSTPLIGTKEILGLSAIPSDPTGLSGKVTDSSILLSWDTPVDLDVLSGGKTQIRYVRNDAVTPKWEIAQVVANRISGSTTTATLPLVPGYYMIKHFDSSGNQCAEPAQILNSFVGPEFNAITTITEDPTFVGTKTNCTVVGGELTLDALATTMTYLFNNSIDLGSVENIRLVPSLTAVITDGVTVVADYDPVSAVTRFAGPIVDAAVNFEVRYTDDDPSGSPVWSEFETFTIGNYRHRAFEFRLTGVVASATYTVSISELSLTADKADVYKRGTSTSNALADVTVTFDTAFYGGIGGTDLPYVGANPVGGTNRENVRITSITATGFAYSIYKGATRVALPMVWQAIGQ